MSYRRRPVSSIIKHSLDSGFPDCVVMSLRGRVTTEAISYLNDIIEIATPPEGRLAMTHDICDTVSSPE